MHTNRERKRECSYTSCQFIKSMRLRRTVYILRLNMNIHPRQKLAATEYILNRDIKPK